VRFLTLCIGLGLTDEPQLSQRCSTHWSRRGRGYILGRHGSGAHGHPPIPGPDICYRRLAKRFHIEQLREGHMVPNLETAVSFQNPKPLQVEMQYSWCDVESDPESYETQSNTQGVWPCILPIDSLSLQLLAMSADLMSDLSKQPRQNFPTSVAG